MKVEAKVPQSESILSNQLMFKFVFAYLSINKLFCYINLKMIYFSDTTNKDQSNDEVFFKYKFNLAVKLDIFNANFYKA